MTRRRSTQGVVPTHTTWGVVWVLVVIGVFAGFAAGLITGTVLAWTS